MRPVSRPSVEGDIEQLVRRVEALERRINLVGQYEIKITSDTQSPTVGDGAFIFAIPIDLDGSKLVKADIYVTTVGGSATTVMVRNITDAVDMLATPPTIDAGDYTSYAGTVGVADPLAYRVATGDRIAIDVDAAGSGAMGLGVKLRFEG
jgi:hypothetical protein